MMEGASETNLDRLACSLTPKMPAALAISSRFFSYGRPLISLENAINLRLTSAREISRGSSRARWYTRPG